MMNIRTVHPVYINKKKVDGNRNKNEYLYASGMGSVVKYDALLACDPYTKDYVDNENFMPADGVYDKYAKFSDLPSFKESHSNASGFFKNVRNFIKTSQKNRASKLRADLAQANASKEAAKSLGKESKSDVLLANALSSKTAGPNKKAMSTGMKIGIGVGVAAVVGVAIYFIVKHKNKK